MGRLQFAMSVKSAVVIISLSYLILIVSTQSTLTCPDNQVEDDCPTDCPSDYCPTSDTEPTACTKPDPCPPPACKCGFNQRKAANGTCIPTRDCPPFSCSALPYQVYDSCPPYCPSDDCSQATPDGECHVFGRIGIVVQCEPKCRCIKHYWRKEGICVPYSQCFE